MNSLMVANVIGKQSLSLTPPVGQSFLIKNIYLDQVSGTFLTVTTGKTTVGYFRVGGSIYNMLSWPASGSNKSNILQILSDRKLFAGYPVAEGETITFDLGSGNSANITVVYEIADAGTYKSTDLNGSMSGNYQYFAIGEPSKVQTNISALIDTPMTPEEFPKFPFASAVPAKTKITIYAQIANPFASWTASGTDEQASRYIKYVKDRTVLFDLDRNGLPNLGIIGNTTTTGSSTTGDGLIIDGLTNPTEHIYLFPKPLEYTAGEELDIYYTSEIIKGSGLITPTDAEIALWCQVTQG